LYDIKLVIKIHILNYIFCLRRRYEEVENILATGDISVKEITSLGKELSSLGRLTELTDKRSEKVKSIEELREVEKEAELAGVDGAEMLQMATEERVQSEEELLAIEDEIVSVVTPKDEIDERNVILEIRAGTGMFSHDT
jgi:peptide chain release factor 1